VLLSALESLVTYGMPLVTARILNRVVVVRKQKEGERVFKGVEKEV